MQTVFFIVPTAIVTAFAVLAVLLLRPGLHAHTEQIAALIPPELFDRVADHLQGYEDAGNDRAFWLDSGGVRGALQRARVSMLLVAICQVQARSGHVTAQKQRDLLRLALMQAWYTAWAVPEAVVCSLWRHSPHTAARRALQLAVHVATQTLLICRQGDPMSRTALDHML